MSIDDEVKSKPIVIKNIRLYNDAALEFLRIGDVTGFSNDDIIRKALGLYCDFINVYEEKGKITYRLPNGQTSEVEKPY
jgi:hypothetical protein